MNSMLLNKGHTAVGPMVPARRCPMPALQPALLSSSCTRSGRRNVIRRIATPSREEEGLKVQGESCPIDGAYAMETVHRLDMLLSLDMPDVDLLDQSSCPHGNVIGIMRSTSEGVLSASPQDTLESTIPKLNKVTGMPVLGPDGRVIGVISRKDIIKVRNVNGSMLAPVAKHMTSPAIVVTTNTSVQQAADLMLDRKIRRLPVVDDDGYPVGIVSRSDIFKPLFSAAYNLYMEKEKAALVTGSPAVHMSLQTKKPITWKAKYLYDGDCPMCLSLMNVLQRQDNGRNLIKFINIADPDYNATKHMGISYDEAMETIHAIQPDGTVLQGTEALRELFNTVGLGWAVRISESPIFSKIVDVIYDFLSTHRLSLGGTLDGIIAAKRMDMSKQGVETCGDVDEQCTAEW